MKDVRPDWEPDSEENDRDQRAAYDRMRECCPVAFSQERGWSVFRHEDVVQILNDPATFSNVVSGHPAVPNGMDPPEHTLYRRIVDRYFTSERVAAFEPACRDIAAALVSCVLPSGNVELNVELMESLAIPFAAQVQCAFLGWPMELATPLAGWAEKSHQATRTGDRKAINDAAREFDQLVEKRIEASRHGESNREGDITADLMTQEVAGRPLNVAEISSILRNWTVGEIGTIAASVGILVHFLAGHTDVQRQLRANRTLLPAAIDEILRLDGPLVANRRMTTCPVTIGDRALDAGERVSINWIAANRDGNVLFEPEAYHPERDPATNLLYGAGIHICPGASLARLELRVVLEELLHHTDQIRLDTAEEASRALYPASGFSKIPLILA